MSRTCGSSSKNNLKELQINMAVIRSWNPPLPTPQPHHSKVQDHKFQLSSGHSKNWLPNRPESPCGKSSQNFIKPSSRNQELSTELYSQKTEATSVCAQHCVLASFVIPCKAQPYTEHSTPNANSVHNSLGKTIHLKCERPSECTLLLSALPVLHPIPGSSSYDSANKTVRVTTFFPHHLKIIASIPLVVMNSAAQSFNLWHTNICFPKACNSINSICHS